MAGTKNSISSLLAQFLRLQRNSLEIINKLSTVTTSKEETVSVEFIDDDELVELTPKTIRIRKRHLLEHERKRAAKE